MQRTHYNTNFTKQQFPITIIGDNISNASNIGSLFRTADAFGVEKLILCGEAISLGRKMTKTSRATEKSVNYTLNNNNIEETLKQYKANGYLLLALEITTNSQSIHNRVFTNKQPIALIIGDENVGVSESILAQCDASLHIDMYGNNSSMNVVQATSIALYEITKQLITE